MKYISLSMTTKAGQDAAEKQMTNEVTEYDSNITRYGIIKGLKNVTGNLYEAFRPLAIAECKRDFPTVWKNGGKFTTKQGVTFRVNIKNLYDYSKDQTEGEMNWNELAAQTQAAKQVYDEAVARQKGQETYLRDVLKPEKEKERTFNQICE